MVEALSRGFTAAPESWHPKYRTMLGAMRALGYPHHRKELNTMTSEEIERTATKLYRGIAKKYHPDIIGRETWFFTNVTYAYNRVKKMVPRWRPKGEGGWDAFYMTEQGGYKI